MSRTVCSLCKAPLVLKDDVLVCANTDCRACDEKYLHETAPLKEIVRLRRTLKDIISATKAKDLSDEGCRMYCADLARIALEARYDEIPSLSEQKEK